MEQNAEKSERRCALACLAEICCNGEAKDADRIAAAKLLIECSGLDKAEAANTLTVKMEGIPKEYLT